MLFVRRAHVDPDHNHPDVDNHAHKHDNPVLDNSDNHQREHRVDPDGHHEHAVDEHDADDDAEHQHDLDKYPDHDVNHHHDDDVNHHRVEHVLFVDDSVLYHQHDIDHRNNHLHYPHHHPLNHPRHNPDDHPAQQHDVLHQDHGHRNHCSPMKISVAIAALNEGPQLAATVSNLLACCRPPEEIVVVDDNSLEPQWLPPWPGLNLVRESSRLGSGPAKHKAASLCTGDLVVVLDAHMRVGQDFFNIIEDEFNRAPLAVLCPRNHGMECNSKHNGMGGKLTFTTSGFWEVRWNEPRDVHHSYAVPAAIGGCYCIPRVLLDRMGGYAPGYYGYGVEEEYLAIRAWIVGGEVRCVPRAQTWHYYRRPIDRRSADGSADPMWAGCYNRHVAAMTCFETQVYEKHYLPKLTPITDQVVFNTLAARKPEIDAARDLIQKNRKQPDAALRDWCGVAHP